MDYRHIYRYYIEPMYLFKKIKTERQLENILVYDVCLFVHLYLHQIVYQIITVMCINLRTTIYNKI